MRRASQFRDMAAFPAAVRLKRATYRSWPVKATSSREATAYLTGVFVKPLSANVAKGFPSVTN
jgi:hypothetical protein